MSEDDFKLTQFLEDYRVAVSKADTETNRLWKQYLLAQIEFMGYAVEFDESAGVYYAIPLEQEGE